MLHGMSTYQSSRTRLVYQNTQEVSMDDRSPIMYHSDQSVLLGFSAIEGAVENVLMTDLQVAATAQIEIEWCYSPQIVRQERHGLRRNVIAWWHSKC